MEKVVEMVEKRMRIYIPKEVQEELGLKPHDYIVFTKKKDGVIIIKKATE